MGQTLDTLRFFSPYLIPIKVGIAGKEQVLPITIMSIQKKDLSMSQNRRLVG